MHLMNVDILLKRCEYGIEKYVQSVFERERYGLSVIEIEFERFMFCKC